MTQMETDCAILHSVHCQYFRAHHKHKHTHIQKCESEKGFFENMGIEGKKMNYGFLKIAIVIRKYTKLTMHRIEKKTQ